MVYRHGLSPLPRVTSKTITCVLPHIFHLIFSHKILTTTWWNLWALCRWFDVDDLDKNSTIFRCCIYQFTRGYWQEVLEYTINPLLWASETVDEIAFLERISIVSILKRGIRVRKNKKTMVGERFSFSGKVLDFILAPSKFQN